MLQTVAKSDPFSMGFYAIAEPSRLSRIEQKRRVPNWLKSGKRGPTAIIQQTFESGDNTQEPSFWDLRKVRFIDHFRKIAVKMREGLGLAHPFAASQVKFIAYCKNIFSGLQ